MSGMAFIRSLQRALVGSLLASLAGCNQSGGPETVRAATAASAPVVAEATTSAHVGAAVCSECHAAETAAWRGSHHDLAMQPANASTVLGDFGGAKFSHFGVVSTFFKRGDQFFVNTDGPDGKLADFEIKYTFGVSPLQQYLIEFPGGRLQALTIAWDSRPKAKGGQRWYHLFPKQKTDAKDALHWTGLYQNWNLQCAECHSTELVKGYNAATASYQTTWKEPNVACEACHGQGSKHVAWAKTEPRAAATAHKGFEAPIASRWKEAWAYPEPGARYAQRDHAADPAVQNSCSACHARRSALVDRHHPTAPLADTHRLATLTAPNYHADGQQREEVFVWGSFLQSKMAQKGVTCVDCHDAHTAKLRADDNALCSRCHNPAAFDAPSHHFHEAGTAGAQCVSCHMPTTNYMVIDARADHSLRVPRPDLAKQLGTPDACTQCHADKPPEWSAAALDGWFGKRWRERPSIGPALHAGATQGLKGVPGLLALAQDASQPGIVRATASELLAPNMRAELLPTARTLLKESDPELRIAALGLIEPADPANRVLAAAPLLTDPVRGVRVAAARVLADIPTEQLPATYRAPRDAALAEHIAALQRDADWPAATASLGNLYLRQGRVEDAITAYRRAVTLDPLFSQGWVNLAEAWRARGDEPQTEAVLREGLAVTPRAAELLHSLGLSQTRQRKAGAALASFAQAAKLAPDNARYGYVLAIAQHSAGKRNEALATLRESDRRHPYNADILSALVSMEREAGDTKAALVHARKMAEALPDVAWAQQMVGELEALSRQR